MLLDDFLQEEWSGLCCNIDSKKNVSYNNISWNFYEVNIDIQNKVEDICNDIDNQKVNYILSLLNNNLLEDPDNLKYLDLDDENVIRKFSKTYLSNLWPWEVYYKWNTFPSTEHWYMYHKFNFWYVINFFKQNPYKFTEIVEQFKEKDFLSKSLDDLNLKDLMIIDNIEQLYFDNRWRWGFIKKLSIEFEKLWLRKENWDEIKLEIMVWLLIEKFSKNEFKEKILLTKPKKLVEWNNWWDIYWWIDINSKEWLNKLWRVLMILRDNFL